MALLGVAPPLAPALLTRADAKSATDAPNSAASCNMAPTAIRRNLPLATLYQHLRERDKQPELCYTDLIVYTSIRADR